MFKESTNDWMYREGAAHPPSEPEHQVQPGQKLPPGPFRSLGGYLDYSDWPERERFLELDRILRTIEPEPSGWEDWKDLPPLRRCTSLVEGIRCPNRFRPTAEYQGLKCDEHRVRAKAASTSRSG